MCSTVIGQNELQMVDVGFDFLTANYSFNETLWHIAEPKLREILSASVTGSFSEPVDNLLR